MAAARGLRRILDTLYLAGGIIAAFFLVAILTIIVLQMLARWSGVTFPGATDYAGYCMAAASFFAFANALGRGAHIRVSILLNAVPKRAKWFLEVWCFGLGTAIAAYFTYYAYNFVFWSWKFNDISQGQDAAPLWIPQSVMVAGGVLLTLALLDNLVNLFLRGEHRIVRDTVDSHGE